MAELKNLKLSAFKKLFKPSLYSGAGLLKIVKDEEGMPIINPTRAVLSKYLSNVSEEGDEFKYVDKYKLPFGYSGYSDKEGKKRMSEEEFNQLDYQAREFASLPEEVDSTRISFLVEGEIESKDEKGNLIIEKLYDLIQFKFLDATRYNGIGTKMQVFNTMGQTSWVASDLVYSKGFETSVPIFPAYDKVGDFGIEEFIDFIYSYGAIAKTDAILQHLNFDAFFEGNVESLVDLIISIENFRVVDKEKSRIELFGVIALATPVNGKSTGNKNSQQFYPVFERGIADSDGTINIGFNKIKTALDKSRIPNKVTKIAYSPESKGIYVGKNNRPVYGFHRIEENIMDAFIIVNGVNAVSRPAIGLNNTEPLKEVDNAFNI